MPGVVGIDKWQLISDEACHLHLVVVSYLGDVQTYLVLQYVIDAVTAILAPASHHGQWPVAAPP